MKNFEDTPQMLSYISWNLKRLADEFERYNDREDERWRKENPSKYINRPKGSENTKLKDFLDKLNGEDNGEV
jgi:hypothetical protein